MSKCGMRLVRYISGLKCINKERGGGGMVQESMG